MSTCNLTRHLRLHFESTARVNREITFALAYPSLMVMFRSSSFLNRTVWTPEIARTVDDLPCATWPIVPVCLTQLIATSPLPTRASSGKNGELTNVNLMVQVNQRCCTYCTSWVRYEERGDGNAYRRLLGNNFWTQCV